MLQGLRREFSLFTSSPLACILRTLDRSLLEQVGGGTERFPDVHHMIKKQLYKSRTVCSQWLLNPTCVISAS